MRKLTAVQSTLQSFASDDVTRYHLNHIGVQNGRLYSTDGHRMISHRFENSKQDIVADMDIFIRDYKISELADVGKYPNCATITPRIDDKFTYITWTPPAWLGELKKTRRNKPALVSINKDCLMLGSNKDSLVTFNAYLISEIVKHYGDGILHVYIRDNLSPIAITGEALNGRQLVDLEWFTVVMPVRSGIGSGVELVSQWEK